MFSKKGIAYLICLVNICSLQTEANTLNTIYQQAKENDHQFLLARAKYEAEMQGKNLARSSLLPSLAVEGNWTKSEGESSGVSAAVVENIERQNSQAISKTESESAGYSISLSQSLFDKAAWHEFKKSKIDVSIAETTFRIEEQELVIRVADLYFNVLKSMENFNAAKEEEKALKQQLEKITKRYESGMTPVTELYQAQAAYDSAFATSLANRGQVAIRFDALEVLTGQSHSHIAKLSDSFPILAPSPADKTDWINFSLKHNLDLRGALLSKRSAKQGEKSAQSAYFPTLRGSIQYASSGLDRNRRNWVIDPETGETRGPFRDVDDTDSEEASVQLTLSMPLFSGGRNTALYRRAKKNAVGAQENYKLVKRNTIQNTRTLHQAVINKVATTRARKQAIASGQRNLKAIQAGYEVGTKDLVDVLNARRTLFNALRDYNNEIYDYILDTLKLKQVAGILDAKDIIQLDKWLDKNRYAKRAE